MVVDSLQNWNLYFSSEDWSMVATFLTSLSSETPEGDYPLKGREIFAKVMGYETRGVETARFESHREYIDIQSVLVGSEGIAWHTAQTLKVSDHYDSNNDIEFYATPEVIPARVDVFPGYFVALYPHDAHMPQLRVDENTPWVKKVVVKIAVALSPYKVTTP